MDVNAASYDGLGEGVFAAISEIAEAAASVAAEIVASKAAEAVARPLVTGATNAELAVLAARQIRESSTRSIVRDAVLISAKSAAATAAHATATGHLQAFTRSAVLAAVHKAGQLAAERAANAAAGGTVREIGAIENDVSAWAASRAGARDEAIARARTAAAVAGDNVALLERQIQHGNVATIELERAAARARSARKIARRARREAEGAAATVRRVSAVRAETRLSLVREARKQTTYAIVRTVVRGVVRESVYQALLDRHIEVQASAYAQRARLSLSIVRVFAIILPAESRSRWVEEWGGELATLSHFGRALFTARLIHGMPRHALVLHRSTALTR